MTADPNIADSYGELGTWFTDSFGVYMGHTLFNGGGHNPYEPVLKGCKVISGPNTYMFAADFKYLESLGLCQITPDAESIAKGIALLSSERGEQFSGFEQVTAARGFSERLAAQLLAPKRG